MNRPLNPSQLHQNKNPPQTSSRRKIRCAIYTRKSSEEGLEQDFNSLDAQREACEAYIKSQRHEGWVIIPSGYDDPAYSGGNMDRPGLKKLLSDIEAGLIDAVVVYKVDRLTRSLTDFVRIVDQFDSENVSFVSVTQAFNTTTSMGRLTLNVLLSFAQFEREVTGERIRDKIAASKKKGMWMGGFPPLGYDNKDRKLIINENEAEKVRHIFNRYCALGSVRALAHELSLGNILSKARVNANGQPYGAQPFSRGALYQLLQNKIYIGIIHHKGQDHRGEHEPIIPTELWLKVQEILDQNRVKRRGLSRGRETKLLSGLIYDASNELMTPTHATKNGIKYYYYISKSFVRGDKSSNPQRIPARSIEDIVINKIKDFLSDTNNIIHVLPRPLRDAGILSQIQENKDEFINQLNQESGIGWREFIQSILVKVRVQQAHVEIDINIVKTIEAMLSTHLPHELLSSHPDFEDEVADEAFIKLRVEAHLKRTGKELRFIIPGQTEILDPDPSLIRLLARARTLLNSMEQGAYTKMEDLAIQHNVSSSYAARLLRLNYLAPDIVEAILSGRQPADLTANKLMKDTRFPLDWREQRRVMGFN